MSSTGDRGVEHFPATSGRVLGWLGVAVAVAVAVSALLMEGVGGLEWVVGAVLAALVVYAAMLRPRVSLAEAPGGRGHLVLRGMTDTVHVPLAAIEEIAVRTVLAVRAGERRFVSSAVGHPWRKVTRVSAAEADARREIVPDMKPADYVEERIRAALDDARRDSGISPWSAEADEIAAGIRRERAWWLVAAMVGLLVLLVVLILV